MPPPLNPAKNMPREPASILRKAAIAAGALRDVSSSSQVPFLNAISGVSFAILGIVQSFKVQKQEYLQLVEQIHQLLWVVIDLCVGSQTTALIPPSILNSIGNFAQTLQKIHSVLERQQAMGTLKRFLRAGNAQQLEQCRAELRDALTGFALHSSMAATVGLAKAQIDEEARYVELITLVTALSGSRASGFSASTGSHSVFTDR
ncbi:hypothetical protein FB451DRAFT_572020 [Mycena latifolia]|nr:hypothetical protein FB451DRAFT_572020 [Mycena latifolia]